MKHRKAYAICSIFIFSAFLYASNAAFLVTETDFQKIRKKAEEGDGISQNNLGVAYMTGQEANVDYAKAKYWFDKAVK